MAVIAFQDIPNRADYLERERRSRPEGRGEPAALPLNPAAGWGIAMLTTFALWWGIWEVVSSLVSTLLS
jgi:hypothetical protein